MDIQRNNFPIMTSAVFFCYLLVAEAEHDSSNSDFSEVRRSKLFIDKTSFIEDFIKDFSIVKIITAPSKSGKSTMVDMLKRFFAMPVDNMGRKIPLNTTANYRLFCQPKLKICENEAFVKDHMGQYPVIHINYHKLNQVHSFESLLQQLRYVIFDTFAQHKYLLQYSSVYMDEVKDWFESHFNVTTVTSLTKYDIPDSLSYLSQLLYKFTFRKIILLLDEYDAFSTNLLFDKIEDKDTVINFLEKLSASLFKDNIYIFKAMLTGVQRSDDVGVYTTKKISEYFWLGDNVFSKYYGLTMEEILKIIKKYTNKSKKINEIQSVIDKYYDRYTIAYQNTTIYNLGSVLRFLKPINNATVIGMEKV